MDKKYKGDRIKTITCLICHKDYKLITQLHLSTQHEINLKKYIKQFPKAKIRPDYNCIECGHLVTYRKSSRAVYCRKCAKEINTINVRYNVQKYNFKRNRYLQKTFTEANREHGLYIGLNEESGVTRVDFTHSSWDFVPRGQNVLGTITDRELEPNADGRIPAALRLQKQIQDMKTR